MIVANVFVEIEKADGSKSSHKGRNTITDDGVEFIRNRMMGNSAALDDSATIYADTTKIGNMEAGYPAWSVTESAVEWRNVLYSVTTGTTVTGMSFYDGDRSGTNPALFSVGVGGLLPVWDGVLFQNDRLRITWRLAADLSLSTLSDVVPGSAVPDNDLQVSVSGSERFIAERVAGLANRNPLSPLNIQFFVPNHTAQLPPAGEEDDPDGGGALSAVNAEQTFRDDTDCPLVSNILGAALMDNSVRFAFDYPARTSSSIFDLLRWYIAYVPGPFVIAAGEILSPTARTIGPVIDDVPLDVTFRNSV